MNPLMSACAAALLLVCTLEQMAAQANPDLRVEITKAGALPEVPSRSNVAFVVTVSNVQAPTANTVLTRVTLPTGFTNVSTQPSPGTGFTCTISGSVVECTTPSVAGNSEKTFRISVTTPATITGQSQSFTLAAIVDPQNAVPEGGPGNSNNSDNLAVTVVPRADLTVSLTGAPGVDFTTQVAPTIAYLVRVRNAGDRAASNLLVRATLPKDVAFVRVEENQLGTCLQNSTASNGALNINCTLSSLAANASAHVRIVGNVLGSVPDRVQVTFAAAADPNNTVPERNDTDNTAFVVTTLRAPSDLQTTAGTVTKRRISVADRNCFGVQCSEEDLMLLEVRFNVKNNGPYGSAPTTVAAAWPASIESLSSVCTTGQVLDTTTGSCVEGRASAGCFSSCSLRALASGQTQTVVLAGLIPVTRSATSVTVNANADPTRTLFESVTSNNTASVTLTAP